MIFQFVVRANHQNPTKNRGAGPKLDGHESASSEYHFSVRTMSRLTLTSLLHDPFLLRQLAPHDVDMELRDDVGSPLLCRCLRIWIVREELPQRSLFRNSLGMGQARQMFSGLSQLILGWLNLANLTLREQLGHRGGQAARASVNTCALIDLGTEA